MANENVSEKHDIQLEANIETFYRLAACLH